MSLFDTLFPRRSRVAEAPQPRRSLRGRSRLVGLGGAEVLERRLPLAITGVVRTTPDEFFIDTGRGFDSGYTAYMIESDGLGPAIDVWVRAANFSPGNVGFGPGINNEDGTYRVGTLDGGVTSAPAFLYFTASGPTATPQTYDIEVWNGDPDDGGTQIGGATTTFTIDSVQETIAAEPNKIDAVSFSPATPVVGDLLVLEVDGRLGNGADRVLFAPATRADWQPDVFELRATDITISGVTQTPDRLSFDPLPTPGLNQQPFTAVYTFLVARAVTTPTAIDPTQFTQDGTQAWKHHKPDDTPFPPIPPVTYELALSKTNGTSTYVPGGTTTWTVTLTNTGKIGVDDVLMTDILPPQVDATTTTWTVDYVNAASGTLGSGGTGDISGTVDLGPLTGGVPGTVTITINANILPSASGAMTNEVTAAPPEGDPLVACDTDLDINLSLTKDDGVTTYTPGGTTTYQIVLANTGLADVAGVVIQDILPPQVDPTSTWQVSYTNAGGTLPAMGSGDIFGTVNLAGSTGVVTITVVAKIFSSATGPLTNTVTAALREGPTLTASDTNARLPDERLTLTKDDGVTTYVPGESTTYTITLTNIGLSDVNGLLVSDLLPPQLDRTTTTWRASYTNATGTLPTTDTTGDILGTVNLQGSGGAVTITIDANILSSAMGPMTNTVTVTNGLTLSASDTNTAAPRADLTATKTDGQTTVVAGDGATYTYTLSVTNDGPSDALAVVVSDTWPAGFAQDAASFAVSQGIVPVPLPNGDFTWSVGTLAPGATATLTVSYTVPAGTPAGVQTNSALVSSPTDQTDTTVSDTTTVVLVADLSILKTDGQDTAVPGTAIEYTITVSNDGPSDVLGAVIDDTLPAEILGATWVATYSPGSSGPIAGSGSLSGVTIDLLAGGTAVFTISGTIDPTATGVIVNTATVTPPDGVEDPNPGDETSTDETTLVPTADLAVAKERTSGPPVAGGLVMYEITVSNLGPSSVTSFLGVDVTNPELEDATYTVSTGTYDDVAGVWTADPGDPFAAGETVVFTLTGTVPATAAGSLVNRVTVEPPAGVVDPDPDNNTAEVDDPLGGRVVLTVSKDDGSLTYKSGGTTIWTIIVTNTGPSFASGIRVEDPLPPQVASATWAATYAGIGSTGPASGAGSIDVFIDLAVGGTATFTLEALISEEARGDMTNTVTATPSPNTGDPVSDTDVNAYDGPINPQADLPGLVLGSDDGCNDEPWVRLVDPETGDLLAQFLAYETTFRGSVRVATGDVTGDGIAEIIVGPGRNRIGEIRVFTPEGIELEAYRTLPFGRRYRGGVEVAAADVTGDGVADIVAGMSSRIGRVSVFEVNPAAADPVVNAPYRSFRGAPGRYRGGVMIAAGDVGSFSNGALVAAAADGRAEIIVGLNAGRRPLVRVFDVSARPRVVQTIRPFTPRFRGGVTLSTAAYQTAGVEDIIIGAGPRGDSTVEVYDGSTGGRVARLDAFASFAKPNAAVFAAALDMNEDGVVDDVFGVQGRAGGGGTRGVKQFDRVTNATTTLTDNPILVPPLRIAPIVLRVLQG